MIPVRLKMRNFMCYRDNVPPLEFTGIRVASGAALDSTVRFAWNGSDPYATLHLAGWTFAVTLLTG